MNQITIYASSVESVDLPVIISADPTGTPPAFALSTTSAVAPGSFTNGTWSVAYANGRATATSATIGSAGTHTIASGNTYSLWCKVVVGSETFVSKVATIYCP